MALICNRCGEMFTLEEYNKMKNKLEVRPIIGGEEASELAQAALKLRRALDGTNPTPKSVEKCEENLLEELADIKVAFMVYLSDSKPCIKARVLEEINKTAEIKIDRWLSRLEAKENKNG